MRGMWLLLAMPLCADVFNSEQTRIRGFLISVSSTGVIEFDRHGREVWRHVCNPYDACRLRNGHVLISDRSAGRVFEVDRQGAVVWEKAGLESPVDADRLSNGNTLICERSRVVEVNTAGDVVWEASGFNNFYDAFRLPNGDTLVADSGNNRIVEVNRDGKVVWEKKGLEFPNTVTRVRRRIYVTTYTHRGAYEIDEKGEITWQFVLDRGTAYCAEPEGSAVWVGDGGSGRVVKVSRDGKVLEEISLGMPFVDCDFLH